MNRFDLVFTKEKGFISDLIMKITKSKYSHVALILDDYHIVEITSEKRLKIRHFNYNVNDYDIYKVTGDFNKEKIIEYIRMHLGAKYDWNEIFRVLGLKFLSDDKKKLICSEFIIDCFEYAGLRLVSEDIVDPQDLLNSKYVQQK